jgi:hypothetical protein
MSVLVALEGTEGLRVEPGRVVSCQMTVSNTSSIVEQFSILFLGDVSGWASAEPPVVSLFPGAQQTVTLTFAPPRDYTTPAGEVPFGVKVIPSIEPDESVTEEGVITVGSFVDIGAELLPRMPTARVLGRQRLAVDSRGNIPVPVAVSAVDASDALRFGFRPSRVTTAPGGAHFVRILIRPRQRFWKGGPQPKPYQVHVEAEGQPPLVLEGALHQKAVLPKGAMLLAALAAVLLLLWFFVVKPAVHNTAVNANKAALAAQQAQTNQLAHQVASAQQQAQAASAAAAAAAAGKPVPTTTTTTSTTIAATTTTTTVKVISASGTTTTLPPPVTLPTDGRLEVVAAPGSTATSATAPIGSGTTLTVTNVVIQNISGSSGTARIERVTPGKPTEDLLVENLSTLTDQEYTFNPAMYFYHDEQLQLRVDCSGNQTACDVGIYYTGPVTEPQSATTTTIP